MLPLVDDDYYPLLANVLEVLYRWHDDNHGTGNIRTCHEAPCRDIVWTVS